MSDPSIGRFFQVDPLAADYVYNSTYAFQENKLGMGIELEGLELIDSNGKLIYDPSMNEGKGGFTDTADRNTKTVINTMRSSKKGEEQFQEGANSTHPITVSLDLKTPASETNAAGTTVNSEVSVGTDLEGNILDASPIKSSITLFGKKAFALEDAAKDPTMNATLGINKKEISSKLDAFDILAAVLGHEIGHTSNENVLLQEQGKPLKEIEKTPSSIGDQILDELLKNKQ
jgi:hypothetical protein